jgi:tripartite-type tricarboxylate transporter receptor subunit TctC
MRSGVLLSRRRLLAVGGSAVISVSAPSLVRANTWPTKPIKIIAGFAAGGQTDQFARVYGDYIGRALGQTVVVENKTGAGGSIAATELVRSDPDGHTLMVSNTTTFMLNPVLMKDIRYDVAKDFTFVTMMPTGSLPLVVSEKTGAKTLDEFIAYARRTEKVNVGTYAAGSYAHIVFHELNKQYGLKMEPIHYRGEAPMWSDLAGNSLDAGMGSYGAVQPLVNAGKARVIAVSRRRMSAQPDVATLQEQGAKSRAHSLLTFQACVAPAGTPREIVARLSDLFVEAAQSERISQLLKSQSVDEGPIPAQASAALYKEEGPIWAELAGGLGLERM